MQNPDAVSRRGFRLSFGQIVCIFAIGVGLTMLGAAIFQRSHPVAAPEMMGKWQGMSDVAGSGQPLVLFLEPNGKARFGTENAFKTTGVIHQLTWGMVGGRLNISAANPTSDLPITHSARVNGDEFSTDNYTSFHKTR